MGIFFIAGGTEIVITGQFRNLSSLGDEKYFIGGFFILLGLVMVTMNVCKR